MMKTSLRIVSLVSVLTVLFALASVVSAQPYGSGVYKVIDKPDADAGVGLAADFAVKERSAKTKTKLTLGSIIKAEDQEAKLGARSLRLCMNVLNDTKISSALAVITMDQYSNFKLVSWARSTCGDGFKPIENGDAGAGLAADFAVKAQAKKTKTTITPATIVKAEDKEPTLGARNFRLCLKTTVNGKATSAQTLVTVDQYSNHKLVRWTEMKCGESGGDDFKPVEKEFSAGVDLAADFAVMKHSKDTRIEHKLVEILKREEKGMFSMTYRICMKVGEEGKTQVIQAIVSVDQYSNMKLVSWEHSTCGN